MTPEITLEEYITKTQEALRFWLDLHTNAEKWADGWCIDEDWQYTLKECPVISNHYFSFDIRGNLARHVAKSQHNLFITCRECGCIYERGWEPDECDSCGNKSYRNTTIVELTDWLEGIGDFNASDEDIRNTLVKDGFKVYQEALRWTIAPVVDEVKNVLRQFRTHNPEKLLQAAVWANHVMHVNGNIVKDYGENVGLDYDLVNAVSQESLAGVFGQDAIDEYLA